MTTSERFLREEPELVGDLLGVLVFVGYGIVVSLAVALALVVFRTGGGDRSRGDAGSSRGERWRFWWRRWR